MAGVVRQVDPRVARCRGPVPSALPQTTVELGGDYQLLTLDTDPDLAADQPRWGGVAHRPEPDRLIGVDQPRLPGGGGERRRRHRMHPSLLDHQRLIRDASGFAVDPAVDLAHERLTRL